jgi:hypothetical protein
MVDEYANKKDSMEQTARRARVGKHYIASLEIATLRGHKKTMQEQNWNPAVPAASSMLAARSFQTSLSFH